jgi:hypothetical protein
MNQRHEHLLLHPQKLPHRLLHLGVLSSMAHRPDPLGDPLGRVPLLLRQHFVFFDDLSDSLQLGADLRLGAGLLQTIPVGSARAKIFFRVSQPIPSLRRTSRFFLFPLNTPSRTLVHHSMSVHTPLSSFAKALLNSCHKEAIGAVTDFNRPC